MGFPKAIEQGAEPRPWYWPFQDGEGTAETGPRGEPGRPGGCLWAGGGRRS